MIATNFFFFFYNSVVFFFDTWPKCSPALYCHDFVSVAQSSLITFHILIISPETTGPIRTKLGSHDVCPLQKFLGLFWFNQITLLPIAICKLSFKWCMLEPLQSCSYVILILQKKNMATNCKSCIWLAEMLNIFSETTDLT